MRISLYCAVCLTRIPLPPPAERSEGEVPCPLGHPAILFRHSEAVREGIRVDSCSRCESTAFFVQKDFDQRLGCLILAGGAILALAVAHFFGGIWFVPVLLLVAAIDFLVSRRIHPVVICYKCDTEYRDVPDSAAYRPYDPHIAERFADVKTVRRMV